MMNPSQWKITEFISIPKPSKIKSKQEHYILMGGPGVGKTTLINRIKELNYATVQEAARDVIQQEREMGLELSWNRPGFRESIVELQIKRQEEAACLDALQVFFDRSPFDTMTYCLLNKVRPSERLISAVQGVLDSHYYNNTVFLIENIGACTSDGIRSETEEESLIIQAAMRQTYDLLGFEIVHIVPGTIESRVNQIIRTVSGDRKSDPIQ
jgi:predicted ATPase